MNNYNIVANYIAKKYISRISGDHLKERIVGDEPIDYVMTGLLAEDRIEQSFEGKYVENLETKYQSIPSIGLKFDVKAGDKTQIRVFPRGLLFYTVKPQYEETVDYFLRLESGKNGETFTKIEQLVERFPNRKFYLPKVYKKVAIQDVFSDGIKIDLDDIPEEGIHLQEELVKRLSSYAQSISNEIQIIHEDQISYLDLMNEDLFSVVCTPKDQKVMPVWKFDIYISSKKIDENTNVFVQMVNRTEKLNRNNCGYLPQIFAAGFDVKGNADTVFMPIELDYFKDNYKDRKQCFSIAENSSSSFDKASNTLSTVNVPIFYQCRTKTNDDFNSYIEFNKLINNPIDNLEVVHKCMQKDLEKREKEFQECKLNLSENAREKFELALEEYEQEIKRFSFGIEQIKYKDMVYKAFVLMNKTFTSKMTEDRYRWHYSLLSISILKGVKEKTLAENILKEIIPCNIVFASGFLCLSQLIYRMGYRKYAKEIQLAIGSYWREGVQDVFSDRIRRFDFLVAMEEEARLLKDTQMLDKIISLEKDFSIEEKADYIKKGFGLKKNRKDKIIEISWDILKYATDILCTKGLEKLKVSNEFDHYYSLAKELNEITVNEKFGNLLSWKFLIKLWRIIDESPYLFGFSRRSYEYFCDYYKKIEGYTLKNGNEKYIGWGYVLLAELLFDKDMAKEMFEKIEVFGNHIEERDQKAYTYAMNYFNP